MREPGVDQGGQDQPSAASALRTPFHLACIAGPDVGAVIPLRAGTWIGRGGDIPLLDPSVSRHHAQVATPAHAIRPRAGREGVHLKDAGSTCGTRFRRQWGPWRRLRADRNTLLHAGNRVRMGSDLFVVRRRPTRLTWPDAPARRPGGWRLATFALPLLFFGVWRLRLALTTDILLTVLGALVLVALLGATLWRRARRRKWAGIDPALLALVLASGAGPEPSGTCALWPSAPGPSGALALASFPPGDTGRSKAGARSRRALAPAGPLASTALPHVRTAGFVGPAARQAALWWAAQICVRLGGCRVVIDEGETRRAGSHTADRGDGAPEGVEIHVLGPRHPVPRKGPETVFVAHAARAEDLPPFCDLVLPAPRPMVSELWWDQCTSRISQQACLPTRIELAQIKHVAPPARPGSLDAILGVDETGPVLVDLVEDGPHALVAGTTGSGKSEALTTWLLSMCERHGPGELRLVLVDYKGGAAFAPLRTLPQVEAVLTDFDEASTERALAGLRALVRHREVDLRRRGFADLASWAKAHAAADGLDGTTTEHPVPPRVVIVIDEFREVAARHPHVLDSLVRLASQGRSMGLHLVAATQRPGGTLDSTIRANMELRLALRCVERADSIDLLGDARAAELPRIPGRAVLTRRGIVQIACVGRVGALVTRIAARAPGASAGAHRVPLWAPPLPAHLSWDEVDAAVGSGDSSSEVYLGLVEALDCSAEVHPPLRWAGGHVRLEGPRSREEELAAAARALGTRLAACADLPLHLLSRRARASVSGCESPSSMGPPGTAPRDTVATQFLPQLPNLCTFLGNDDATELAIFLDEVLDHGPAVVVVEDLAALVGALDDVVGAATGRDLLTRLFTRARGAGLVLVAAAPGAPADSAGTFTQRFVAATSTEELLRAGLPKATPPPALAGRFLHLGAGGEICTVHVPIETYSTCSHSISVPTHGTRSVGPSNLTGAWATQPSDTPSDLPIRIGADLGPVPGHEPRAWIVIGDEGDRAQICIRNWAALHLFDPPEAVEESSGLVPLPGQILVLPPDAWPRLRNCGGAVVLAPNPTEEVTRALRALAREASVSVLSHRHGTNGIALVDGRAQRLVLGPATRQA